MLAVVAAVIFAIDLLFDLLGTARSDAFSHQTLLTLGLLFVALHLAGFGPATTWRRGRRR